MTPATAGFPTGAMIALLVVAAVLAFVSLAWRRHYRDPHARAVVRMSARLQWATLYLAGDRWSRWHRAWGLASALFTNLHYAAICAAGQAAPYRRNSAEEAMAELELHAFATKMAQQGLEGRRAIRIARWIASDDDLTALDTIHDP